jgi:hypothetical protein
MISDQLHDITNIATRDEAHWYTPEGESLHLPGVTRVIREAGLYDERHWTQEARDRGSAVHQALHYLDEGDLDEASIDPAIGGYIAAWQRFMRESGAKVLAAELPLYHPARTYGGTIDRILETPYGYRMLVDIKTGPIVMATWVQLFAYAQMLPAAHCGMVRRGIRLDANGCYSLVAPSIHLYQQIGAVWNAALTLYHHRKQEGLCE